MDARTRRRRLFCCSCIIRERESENIKRKMMTSQETNELKTEPLVIVPSSTDGRQSMGNRPNLPSQEALVGQIKALLNSYNQAAVKVQKARSRVEADLSSANVAKESLIRLIRNSSKRKASSLYSQSTDGFMEA